jgi:amidohydrolase
LDIHALKQKIQQAVDTSVPELTALSRLIHSHPEPGFQEAQAATWLADYLAQNGFAVERGIYGLPTAFRATYGHACGHNIIGVSAAGAAISARAAVDCYGGTLLVLGTPAEELYGGKILMVKQGAFGAVDAALMAHPGNCNAALSHSLACQTLEIEFAGRAAHAASRPESGVNALEALILAFNAVNSLRQHIKDRSRIHGIITDGGSAANIVPEHSAATFLIRAEDPLYLEDLKQKVLRCFQGAAEATGAQLKYHWDEKCYAPLRLNTTLGRLFQANLAALGRDPVLEEPAVSLGSTDMGNVSQVAPALHGLISITAADTPLHTPEFARAAVSEAGMNGLRDAAKALAMTAADLLADPSLIDAVKKEFYSRK